METKMCTTIAVSLLIGSLIWASVAEGDDRLTGADIATHCGAVYDHGCAAYVAGVAEALQFAEQVCFQDGIAPGLAVATYIKSIPELLGQSRFRSVAIALMAIYPCKTI